MLEDLRAGTGQDDSIIHMKDDMDAPLMTELSDCMRDDGEQLRCGAQTKGQGPELINQALEFETQEPAERPVNAQMEVGI